MQEHLLTTGIEIKSIYYARSIFKFVRSTINHIENNSALSFHRTAGFYGVTKSATRHRHCEDGRNSFKVNTGMESLQIEERAMVTLGRGMPRWCEWRGHVGTCFRGWIYSSAACVITLGADVLQLGFSRNNSVFHISFHSTDAFYVFVRVRGEWTVCLLEVAFFSYTCPVNSGRSSWCVLLTKYEGNSISKLQIVIEKNRMEIMTYKQHLFFNIISIQI